MRPGILILMMFNPFSATRRYKCHQNKVKVKGLSKNSSYLAEFSIFFHGSMKKFNQLAKNKLLKIFLSTIKTKVAIKFPKKLFFFLLKIGLVPKRLILTTNEIDLKTVIITTVILI